MLRVPRILINYLSYTIPDTLVKFERLNLSFDQRRYGIVGDNGVGKTTLFKLIVGLIRPHQGYVHSDDIAYCPQNYNASVEETIAETLGISEKLQALFDIQQGNFSPNNYEKIDNDWDIESHAKQLLLDFGLEKYIWDDKFLSLSGGQKTKCLLIRAMLAKADFILLDEPTNNLDLHSREKLYQWVNKTNTGLLVISHDRYLLNHMDVIIEVTTKGVHQYGGNFDFYQEQKRVQQAALYQQMGEAKKQLQVAKTSIQKTYEKHAQRSKKGKLLKKRNKIDKLTANSMKGRSEKTQSRHVTLADHMLTQAEEKLMTAKSKLEIHESIAADLAATYVPCGKMVLEMEAVSFAFPNKKPLLENFNLSVKGPERIAILGENGSGKTTLIKLILGKLKPDTGRIKLNVTTCYLDQEIKFLDSNTSLIENYSRLNPDITIRDAYFALASFNFRNKDAEKQVINLSGGERIRAGLAISLLAKVPPQLIILDEPTNYLDIRSIEAVESALRAYQGAIVVISHDQYFLKHIEVDKYVNL